MTTTKGLSLVLCAAVFGCAGNTSTGGAVGESGARLSSGTIYNFGTLVHPGACMDARFSGTDNGTQIQEWWCNGSGAQSFALGDAGGGAYTIINTNAGKCVDVSARGTANGTKIQLWDCNGTPAQSFWIQPQANGLVTFVNTNSNKCLDVAGANPADGTVVQLYDCNGTNAQLWNPAVIGTTGNGGSGGSGGGPGNSGLVFSAYKDTSISLNWNTNVVSTNVTGTLTPLTSDLSANGGKTITLAFATGECGSENWGGVPGAAMASANVSMLDGAGLKYILSTGGAAGSFTCGSDGGFTTFINRWMGAGLVGVDFDIEAGQSQDVINNLVARIKAAHASFPNLRFSLTLATLANNNGAASAQSLGGGAPDSFNYYGDNTLNAVKAQLGFDGSAGSWPSYLTVNLMTMDYGSPSAGVCVVAGGVCQMGQSALQAAYNLHDHWGVPYSAIELTPMIGGNDTASEQFTLGDADTVAQFAVAQGLAGVHYWSYDRDVDCAPGYASPTCNSIGNAGTHGYLKRFMADGLR